MPTEPETNGSAASAEEEAEEMEIHVDVTDDHHVSLAGDDWEVILTPEEARELGEALMDAADDADGAGE